MVETITAGGKTRTKTQHRMINPHTDVTDEQIVYVLENWSIRGVKTDEQGRHSWNYIAVMLESGHAIVAAVSLDDEKIITAYRDHMAKKHLERGNFGYFARKLGEMERPVP